MLSFRALSLLILALSLSSGCISCVGGTGDDSAEACTTPLTNDNNYSWTGVLNIPNYTTAEKEDIKLDFTALTEDMLCHAMDPVADVDSLGLTRFPLLTQAEIATGLTNNSLLQSNTDGYVSCEPGDLTTCMLSDFTFGGSAYEVVESYEAAGGAFLLSISKGFDPAQGALFLLFLDPQPTSTVTEIEILPTCDIVDYDVDLESRTPAVIPDDCLTIDWSGLTVSGNGEPLLPGKLDEVLIAHYATLTPGEIDDQFTDVEILADETYTLELTGGTTADLSGAVSAEGVAFEGFTAPGTWLLGLRCTANCTNPAPMFMTVVVPG